MSKTEKKMPNPNWKTLDLKKAAGQDLEAALSFLGLIRDNPEIFALVVQALEEWRIRMIENEQKQDAPLMSTNGKPLA